MSRTFLFLFFLVIVQIFNVSFNLIKFSVPYVYYSFNAWCRRRIESHAYVPKLIEKTKLYHKLTEDSAIKSESYNERIDKIEKVYQESAELIIKKWVNDLKENTNHNFDNKNINFDYTVNENNTDNNGISKLKILKIGMDFNKIIQYRMKYDLRSIFGIICDKSLGRRLAQSIWMESRNIHMKGESYNISHNYPSNRTELKLNFPKLIYNGPCSNLPELQDIIRKYPNGFAFKARHTSGMNMVLKVDDLNHAYVIAHRPGSWGEMNLKGIRMTPSLFKSICSTWSSPSLLASDTHDSFFSKLLSIETKIGEYGYSLTLGGIIIEERLQGPEVMKRVQGVDKVKDHPITNTYSNLRAVNFDSRQHVRDNIPDDFKCLCFHGQTEFVSVVGERFNKKKKTDTFYQRININEYRVLKGFSYTHSTSAYPASVLASKSKSASAAIESILIENVEYQERVMNDRVKEAAEICNVLAKGFDFIRIDLFATNKGWVFGEYTAYPGAGKQTFKSTTEMPNFNQYLGQLWYADAQE